MRYIISMDLKSSQDNNILISIVTPVYNGEKFVRQAYECLLRQTYRTWEWVVVDDGSADKTLSILRQIAEQDCRIKVFTQPNSGACKYPRDRAVAMAAGRFVLPLDIDDTLSEDYLETMLRRQQEPDADIVYLQMHFINVATGKTTLILPVKDFDATRVYEGRQLVKETMPEWRIGCNGGLYRREAWLNSSYPDKKEPAWVYSDEVDERIYQIHAQRIAFSAAQYNYMNYPESLTGSVSPKQFHLLITSMQLKDLIAKYFGHNSEEYRRSNTKLFYNWRTMMAAYVKHQKELACAEGDILTHLKDAFHQIEPELLTRKERLRFLNFCSYPLLFLIFCLKYHPTLIFRKALQHFVPDYYRWSIIRRETESKTRKEIATSYGALGEGDPKPYVVSMFCGNTKSGGLVDRLRGAISVYQTCKTCGRPFRLYFTHPFNLHDYLVPNLYDWSILPEDVSFDTTRTALLVNDSQTDKPWERNYQRRLFQKLFTQNEAKQVHCYTNAAFCYDKDFAKSFHELFKPSERLAAHLEKIQEAIGQDYLTISARFCNLLDDFNEEVYCEPLSADGKERLLAECIRQIKTIQEEHQGLKVVVCSDSTTFLKRAIEECHAFVIDGTVSHIGNDETHSYEYYEKTFLDFFTIAAARHVYLLRGPRMHNSGFPYAAALSGDKPYDVVSF